MKPVQIETAAADDAEPILELQELTYQSEALTSQQDQIAKISDSMPDLIEALQTQCFLKAVRGGRLVGTVRASQDGDKVKIEHLIVHPDAQRQGIGARLVKSAENHFPAAPRYELTMGVSSERDLSLYEKMGYVKSKVEHIDGDLNWVSMEKFGQPE